MRFFIGSLIISFGIVFLFVVILNSMQIRGPENALVYMGIAWVVLAIVLLPFAKKIIR